MTRPDAPPILPDWDHPFWRNREVITCAVCGLDFPDAVSRKRKVCSEACAITSRSGKGSPHYNGGLHTRKSDGRTSIMCRDGTHVLYYRAVMEAELRRPLHSDEQIHHINGDCGDDRIENLQLISPADHTRLHRVIEQRWARVRKHAWSTEYPECIECGTTERDYEAHGLCTRCYMRAWVAGRKAAA